MLIFNCILPRINQDWSLILSQISNDFLATNAHDFVPRKCFNTADGTRLQQYSAYRWHLCNKCVKYNTFNLTDYVWIEFSKLYHYKKQIKKQWLPFQIPQYSTPDRNFHFLSRVGKLSHTSIISCVGRAKQITTPLRYSIFDDCISTEIFDQWKTIKQKQSIFK